LHYAACKGHLDNIIVLLENGADINWCGNRISNDKTNVTPLKTAVWANEFLVVKLLVEKGADINKCLGECETPLTLACRLKYFDIAKYLLNNNAMIDGFGDDINTPLFYSCLFGNYEMTELLLEKNADIYASCVCSDTPFVAAKARGHDSIVKLLKNHLWTKRYIWLLTVWKKKHLTIKTFKY
jgi:ankyrin repeat protein